MKNNSGEVIKRSRFQVVNIIKSEHPIGVKLTLIWRRCRNGVANIPVYFFLIAMSFVFILPFIYMILQSMINSQDLANPMVEWLPRDFNSVGDNYNLAIISLNYWDKLFMSLWTTALAVIGQLISCNFVAYGLARLKFKGNGIIFALVIFTLIIPPQVIMAPSFYMFSNNSPFGSFFNWSNTFLPVIVPCFFALGLTGGLFVFIYRQYFRSMPSELENAALIDGCGIFGAYFRVILPNAKSPMLVCFLLSFVWQWNNYLEPNIYIFSNKALNGNLPMQLSTMTQNIGSGMSQMLTNNTPVKMAATFLVVAPILLLFFVMQNQFMKSIERVGLAN